MVGVGVFVMGRTRAVPALVVGFPVQMEALIVGCIYVAEAMPVIATTALSGYRAASTYTVRFSGR